ncbi:MAG: hypothetical protein ACQEUZ_01850 [Pseudomonadota bacterium]
MLSPGWELSSVLRVGHGGDDDEHWITKFAQEGGDAILSADRDFLNLAPQVNAVFETGLRVIHLPHNWGQAKGYLQAAHILQWWPRIEEVLKAMKARECFRPDWNMSERGKLKKVSINFQKAQKQRKRDRKRAAGSAAISGPNP